MCGYQNPYKRSPHWLRFGSSKIETLAEPELMISASSCKLKLTPRTRSIHRRRPSSLGAEEALEEPRTASKAWRKGVVAASLARPMRDVEDPRVSLPSIPSLFWYKNHAESCTMKRASQTLMSSTGRPWCAIARPGHVAAPLHNLIPAVPQAIKGHD
jgi:hypothetical protein